MRYTFLASVYDNSKPLKSALPEASALNEIVNLKQGWSCTFLPGANMASIGQLFARTDISFQIFHFAGHAFDQKLQFQGDLELESTCMVFPQGLAELVTHFHALQLVFLNGCSTNNQVQFFLDKGVEAVIATTRPLKDEYGFQFAQRFYESFFKSELGLKDAFEFALKQLAADCGNFTNDWLNNDLAGAMTRGGLVLSAPANKPVYELSLLKTDFGKKKMSEWPAPKSSPISADPGQDKTAKIELPLQCTLLCNRSDESDHFEDVLETLLDSPPPLPVFFFIHEMEEACPLKISERFELFGISEFCHANRIETSRISWKPLELPERRHLKNIEKCRWRLSEIYSHHFPCEQDPAKGRYFFKQPEQPDRVIMIHHDLNYNQVEWHDDLQQLFDFYLGEFSQILATELSTRIAVLFSIEYYDPASPFRKFFNDLANAHQQRVRNLTGMARVSKAHIGNWRRKIFIGKTDADLPPIEEMFPYDPDASMLQTQKALMEALRMYNQKLSGQHV